MDLKPGLCNTFTNLYHGRSPQVWGMVIMTLIKTPESMRKWPTRAKGTWTFYFGELDRDQLLLSVSRSQGMSETCDQNYCNFLLALLTFGASLFSPAKSCPTKPIKSVKSPDRSHPHRLVVPLSSSGSRWKLAPLLWGSDPTSHVILEANSNDLFNCNEIILNMTSHFPLENGDETVDQILRSVCVSCGLWTLPFNASPLPGMAFYALCVLSGQKAVEKKYCASQLRWLFFWSQIVL